MDDWDRYGTEIDLDDPEDSRARVLRAVARHPSAADILELGCSSGRTTAVLQRWGRHVTAVELDAQSAAHARPFTARLVEGDLDRPETLDSLGDDSFDLLIAADVLEHLTDPLRCLRQALGRLRPGGIVVLSIPNVAHGDLRLALLAGHFDYTDIGLLDRTHVRLFTRDSLERLVADAGLRITHWDRVAKLIGHTEVHVEPEILDWGRMLLVPDPDSITYQWIVECRRVDDPSASVVGGTPATDGSNWWLESASGSLADRVNHVAHHMIDVARPRPASLPRRALRRLRRIVAARSGDPS